MKRKNLVVVRAGDRSLHQKWLEGGDRNWDLVVSYFGDNPDLFARPDVTIVPCKGSKWQGLASYLANHAEVIGRYARIWFPDDDLLLDTATINRFFDLSEKYDLALSQPALTWESYFSHRLTFWRPFSECRYTNFVEVMAPCFRADLLDLVGYSFGENTSGWGLEYLWTLALDKCGFRQGIVDATCMFHTRPVGSAGHGGANDPLAEEMRLLEKYNIQKWRGRTLRVVYGGITRPPLISDRNIYVLRQWMMALRGGSKPG